MNEEERKQKARENAKRYYQKNKKKILEKQKEYVKKKYANDEEFRKKAYERSRKYVKSNQEKVREMKRNWARKHYKELREKGLMKPSKNEVIENLQSKIDKAIEYVNTWLVDEYSICIPDKEYPDTACVYEPDAIDKLLDILKEDK